MQSSRAGAAVYRCIFYNANLSNVTFWFTLKLLINQYRLRTNKTSSIHLDKVSIGRFIAHTNNGDPHNLRIVCIGTYVDNDIYATFH